MKKTSAMIARVKELADELFYEYEIVGLRIQDVPFELGKIDHCSKVWVDGEETDEYLDGICVIRADQIDQSARYFGDHIAVLAGNDYTYGEDVGEIILSDAVVVEILA